MEKRLIGTTLEAIGSVLGRPVGPVCQTSQTDHLQNRANGSKDQSEQLDDDKMIMCVYK